MGVKDNGVPTARPTSGIFLGKYLDKKFFIPTDLLDLISGILGQKARTNFMCITFHTIIFPLSVVNWASVSAFQVKSWVKELRKMLGTDVCLRIIGNKIDLEKDRHVSVEEAMQ